jgi:hypothetical protein
MGIEHVHGKVSPLVGAPQRMAPLPGRCAALSRGVIARSACDEANPALSFWLLDCFAGARNDGMTIK